MLPSLVPWSVGSFPPGPNPWSSTPYRAAPTVSAWTPGVPALAQNANYLIGGAIDYARALETAVCNLSAQVTPSGYTTVRSAAFDKRRGLWLLGGGNNPIMTYNTGGDSWSSGVIVAPGTSGASVVGLGVSPAGNLWYCWLFDGTNFVNYYSSNQGATWTLITTYLSTSRTVDTVTFGAIPVIAVGGVGATGFLESYSSPETAPVDLSSGVSLVSAPSWLLRASTTSVVAIPNATSTVANMVYYTSTNGTTWTTRSFDSSIVANGDAPTALTWVAEESLFVLAVTVSAGASERFAVSPDGVTWTVVATLANFSSPGYYVSDLSSLNGIIIGISNDLTVAPESTNAARLIYSADLGATWQWSAGSLTGGTTSTQRPSSPLK